MLNLTRYNALEVTMEGILTFGDMRPNRTGTDAISLFAQSLHFSMQNYPIGLQPLLPLITSKRVPYKMVVGELLWFLEGGTNIHRLKELGGGNIWDEWANEVGELGPIYGSQWRDWRGDFSHEGFDQIAKLIETIRTNPTSRRMIVSAWNVADLQVMALEPCHVMFQCYVDPVQKRLDMQVYQRSADMFLGVPFNIASYATLVHMLAHITGLTPGRLTWVGGDCHIYRNHIEQCDEMITRQRRDPRPWPTLKPFPDSVTEIEHFKPEHFELVGYDPHPAIKGEVAV
jgi:thymidylate synthase